MRSAIETRVREDAAGDPAFRAALIADAAAAVSERYGLDVPSGTRIRVIEEAADEVVLVLPALRGTELSELELELVAGGSTYTDSPCGNTSTVN